MALFILMIHFHIEPASMLYRYAFIAFIFLFTSVTANAQGYIGGSFSLLTYKDSDVRNTFNVSSDNRVKADADLGLLNLTLGIVLIVGYR